MPSSDFVATIVAGGQRYSAWTSVLVRHDYANYISTFEFTATENTGTGPGFAAIKLQPGDPVQILLGGTKVIDGSVTTRTASFDERSHDLVIAGKSLTQKIDTSVEIKPGTYNGSTFEQAARGVLGPTGVKLVVKNPPSIISKPFKSLSPQFGESVGEFIERIAKMRGLFLSDDHDGNLVASQVNPSSAPVAELQEGRNILRAVGTIDNQSAWSGLTGSGQHTGDDENYPPRDFSASVQGPANGNGRTRVFHVEHPGDADEMKERVNFEAAYASWRSVEFQVIVVGWHKDDGSLWVPTENVTILSATLVPNDSGGTVLGIQGCTYAQDVENGTTTTLSLKLPQSLTTLPSPIDGATEYSGSSPANPKPGQAQIDRPDTI